MRFRISLPIYRNAIDSLGGTVGCVGAHSCQALGTACPAALRRLYFWAAGSGGPKPPELRTCSMSAEITIESSVLPFGN